MLTVGFDSNVPEGVPAKSTTVLNRGKAGWVHLLTFCIEHLSYSMEELQIMDSAIHAKQQSINQCISCTRFFALCCHLPRSILGIGVKFSFSSKQGRSHRAELHSQDGASNITMARINDFFDLL
jgi:hypothetical protein